MKIRLNRFCPPLLPVFVALGVGVCAGVLPAFSPAWSVLAGVIFIFPFLIYSFFRPGIWFAFLCFSAAIWGGVSMSRINTPLLPDNHISRYADGSGRVVSGTIVSLARHYPGKTMVVVACSGVLGKQAMNTAVLGRIRLNIYGSGNGGKNPLPGFGDKVQFYTCVHPIRNFANPDGYDYEARMRYRDIGGTAHVRSGKIKILPQGVFSLSVRFFRRVEFLRTRFWHQVKELGNIAPENKDRVDAAAVLTALITGKKEVLPKEVREGFSRAGVSHLLAISGFHLSLVALGFYFVFNLILSRIYVLSITGWARKLAGVLTLIPVAAYALFTGFSPSTQRALIMVTVFMAAVFWEKEKDPMNVLCLAGILILSIDPPALFSISFQLSFMAVIFIILGLSQVYKKGWMPGNRLAVFGAGLFWVSLFAGMGTGPLIARYFNMVSCVQVFANLVVVPVIGFVCLPLGIIGFLLTGIHESGLWVLSFTLDMLVFCIRFIMYITELSFSWIRVVTPSRLDLVLIYMFLGAVYLAGITQKKTGFVFLGLVVAAGAMSVGSQLENRFSPGQLFVTVLDVGQGNAAVVRTPEGQVILIDGGGFSGRSGFDTGRFLVAPFLWRHWVKTLDAVILTHPQSDHMNGLVFVMKNFRVKKWIRNRDKNNTRAFAALTQWVQEKNIPGYFPSGLGLPLNFGSVDLMVMPDSSREFPGDLNNNSLVCRLRIGDFTMLFAGDIEARREMLLARNSDISLVSQVLLAPHHGSQSSSSKVFLDKVRPQGVIISCGYNNRYGFPHPVIVKRYRQAGVEIYRTDIQGAVTVISSGNGYDIKTHRNE